MNFSLLEGFPHHAYLVEGEHKEIFPLLVDFLKKQKLISVTGDIYQKFSETFTIDFSRLIKSHQIQKSPHKFFISLIFIIFPVHNYLLLLFLMFNSFYLGIENFWQNNRKFSLMIDFRKILSILFIHNQFLRWFLLSCVYLGKNPIF